MKTKTLLFAVTAIFLATLNASAQEPPTTIELEETTSEVVSKTTNRYRPVKQRRNQFGFNVGLGAANVMSFGGPYTNLWGPDVTFGGRWLRNGDGNVSWNVLNFNMHVFMPIASDSYFVFEMAQVTTGLHCRADSFYFDANVGLGLGFGMRYELDDYTDMVYAAAAAFEMGVVAEVSAGFYVTRKFYMGAYANFQTLLEDNSVTFFGLKFGFDF